MFSHLAFSNLLLPQHSRKHLSLKPIDIHIPSLRQLHEALPLDRAGQAGREGAGCFQAPTLEAPAELVNARQRLHLEAALGPGEKDPPRRPRLLFRAGGGDLEPAPGEKEPCRPSLLLRLFLAGGDLIKNMVKNKILINNLISFYVQF